MSRLQARFNALKQQGRKALIPYVTAGDPQPQATVEFMHAMVDAGADIIELGVPFSDPMADGPVIQLACERALEHDVTLDDVLGMVKTFRERDNDTPVVLMGYLNPIEIKGYAEIARAAEEHGVDGLLTVDLPPEESHDLVVALKEKNIDPIFLAAPTSNEQRLKCISAVASGFIYYVSLKGVTGSNALDVNAVAEKLNQIRQYATVPVGVGFGIRDAETAARVAQVADAVVVGSALVQRIADNANDLAAAKREITEVLSSMRSAMDAAA